MPTLIYEQFYMPILLLNTYGFDIVLKTARGLELRMGPWANTKSLRVHGQLETTGSVHSVTALESLRYPPIVRLHPVRFDGDPHFHMAIAWIVPLQQEAQRPWESFNTENQYIYTMKAGIVTIDDLSHRTSLLQRLKTWCRVRHVDHKYEKEILGVWTPDQEGT